MRKNIWFIVGLTLCFAVLGCEDGGETGGNEKEPQFVAEEFVVQSADFAEKFGTAQFLPPLLVESSDEAVVKAELRDDALVITSVGQGSATVMISDWRSKSNAARIEAQVSETGGITTMIHPFVGEIRKAVVKEAVTIGGKIGVAIAPRSVRLMMDGTDFIEIDEAAASTWINNLPAGLTAGFEYIQSGEHSHEVTLLVSGTPTAASAEPLSITIPAENTSVNLPVNVDPRSDVKFAID
ncbi:MAG: hypothetical protein LBL06_01725 [Treponema sp.]|jgi:hypothetical protein|nr:hypothetical protein [Treponema sp.]